MRTTLAIVAFSIAVHAQSARRGELTVTNPTADARPSETITLAAGELQRVLGPGNLQLIHVRDDRSVDLLTQAIDVNDDGTFDELIFQTDLEPGETRRFTLATGERRIPKKEEFRAYGRFVRERRDDFAWENDLVAHRMYGAALETWAQEPLTSSGLDVWVKRTPRLVINEWYMVDDYQGRRDHDRRGLGRVPRTRGRPPAHAGDGASRGCAHPIGTIAPRTLAPRTLAPRTLAPRTLAPYRLVLLTPEHSKWYYLWPFALQVCREVMQEA